MVVLVEVGKQQVAVAVACGLLDELDKGVGINLHGGVHIRGENAAAEYLAVFAYIIYRYGDLLIACGESCLDLLFLKRTRGECAACILIECDLAVQSGGVINAVDARGQIDLAVCALDTQRGARRIFAVGEREFLGLHDIGQYAAVPAAAGDKECRYARNGSHGKDYCNNFKCFGVHFCSPL